MALHVIVYIELQTSPRYMELVSHWRRIREHSALETVQQRLLSHALESLGCLPVVQKVPVSQGILNTVTIQVPTKPIRQRKSVVMIHGYGSGLGAYCRNMASLANFAASANTSITLMDLLGHGLSTGEDHPKAVKGFSSPKLKIDQENSTVSYVNSAESLLKLADLTEETLRQCEDYYVNLLEDWRKSQKLDHFTLLGHSFGAYLLVCYAIKYPHRVDNLVLVLPVGVERLLYLINSMREHARSGKLKDIVLLADPSSSEYQSRLLWAPSFFIRLWDSAVLPFPALRLMGPFGVWLALSFTSRRYTQGSTDPEELNILQDYMLSAFWRKLLTEQGIMRLLLPILAGREPVLDKLEEFKRRQEKDSSLKFPRTLFMYGDKDWMDIQAGEAACQYINDNISGGPSEFVIVEQSGHNIFLDNPQGFDQKIAKFMGW